MFLTDFDRIAGAQHERLTKDPIAHREALVFACWIAFKSLLESLQGAGCCFKVRLLPGPGKICRNKYTLLLIYPLIVLYCNAAATTILSALKRVVALACRSEQSERDEIVAGEYAFVAHEIVESTMSTGCFGRMLFRHWLGSI